MKTIQATNKYKVCIDDDGQTIRFEGTFRMGGVEEYGPIQAELETLLESGLKSIILDLTRLEFLNSSGISFLAKFVILVRKKGHIGITVIGSMSIPWQGKSLPNLQKLFPALKLVLQPAA
ncbi:MAG: hypothetical protein A2Y14_01015 [Verrucomicrobia bacterium GWF2_51_19]|nr:MAG: hypothetical protein A2Y14_01015 [Verrucomicrobia bacterium GWF2_51_19]HCJ12063.1 hypothetical protein [Opitutae bacterium]